MNEEQKLRLDILRGCNFNVEVAQKCIDFIRGGEVECKHNPLLEYARDGVYYVYDNGFAERFAGNNPHLYVDEHKVEYIGFIQGLHSIAIALHDVSVDEITLTSKKDDTLDHYIDSYIDSYVDAVQDWQGKQNTEHLQAVGLNSAIQLKDGEYIPTLAELYLICLNRKAINAAMRFVGGQELAGWYWSSTEHSETYAWGLSLSNGYAGIITKATDTGRVRLVREFRF